MLCLNEIIFFLKWYAALRRFATVELRKGASYIDFHLVERTGVVEKFGKFFVEVINGKQQQTVDCVK